MNVVSRCCGACVVHGHRQFFPLSRRDGYMLQMVDFCENCETILEPGEIDYACEICGEVGCDENCDEEPEEVISNYAVY